jgi:hypothetical protein
LTELSGGIVPAAASHPRARRLVAPDPTRDESRNDGEFLRGRIPPHDPQRRAGGLGGVRRAHNGIFPCFFGGSDSRLFRSMRSALMTYARVCDGGITESM